VHLMITGATGFIGRFVVAEAVRRGHRVSALVRPTARAEDVARLRHPRVAIAPSDLLAPDRLADRMHGVDAVVHLAVAKQGDPRAQRRETVAMTEAVLGSMVEAGVQLIVGVSSFAVYDFQTLAAGGTLSEEAAVQTTEGARDEYSRAKLMQEEMIRGMAQRHGWASTIIRPGAVFGPGRLWTPRLGSEFGDGRWWLRIGSGAEVPVAYVENCAEAVVLGAGAAEHGCLVVNVVDDERPTQAQYASEVLRRVAPRPRSVTLPWPVLRLAADCAGGVNDALLRGRLKLPSILVPARVHARFKPLRYSNARLHERLGWKQRFGLAESLDRAARGVAPDFGAASPEPVAACTPLSEPIP